MDYALNLTDALSIVNTLFLGAREIICPQAGDFNEDALIDLSDAIGILSYLFLGGAGVEGRPIICSTEA